MNLLHISSDYPYTSLYRDLVKALGSDPALRQTMYVPLSRAAGPPSPEGPSSTSIVYSRDYSNIHRPLYHRKRRRIHRRLIAQLDPSTFDLVHAHFLFSAGGVAYELLQRSSLPYVVSVRSTDVNLFFRRMPHLRTFGLEIMRAAKQVIFVSPAHEQTVFDRYVPPSLRAELAAKTIHVPNGIDPWWLEEQPPPRRLDDGMLRLLFVGSLTRNKNVGTVITATKRLRELGVHATLHIIGSGPREAGIIRLARRSHDFIEHEPRLNSRTTLREAYREADIFVMPSIHETFGMVYTEAMSQGLPIIYGNGQGIDGYFEQGSIGYGVDPRSVEDVIANIQRILSDYEDISAASVRESRRFSWTHVAAELQGAYADATS